MIDRYVKAPTPENRDEFHASKAPRSAPNLLAREGACSIRIRATL
jgi:hypothetical protein